jgi:hypothetical protein
MSHDFAFGFCARGGLRKTHDLPPVRNPAFARLHYWFLCALRLSQDVAFASRAWPGLRTTSLFFPVRTWVEAGRHGNRRQQKGAAHTDCANEHNG